MVYFILHNRGVTIVVTRRTQSESLRAAMEFARRGLKVTLQFRRRSPKVRDR
jgi:hypothetical protein